MAAKKKHWITSIPKEGVSGLLAIIAGITFSYTGVSLLSGLAGVGLIALGSYVALSIAQATYTLYKNTNRLIKNANRAIENIEEKMDAAVDKKIDPLLVKINTTIDNVNRGLTRAHGTVDTVSSAVSTVASGATQAGSYVSKAVVSGYQVARNRLVGEASQQNNLPRKRGRNPKQNPKVTSDNNTPLVNRASQAASYVSGALVSGYQSLRGWMGSSAAAPTAPAPATDPVAPAAATTTAVPLRRSPRNHKG